MNSETIEKITISPETLKEAGKLSLELFAALQNKDACVVQMVNKTDATLHQIRHSDHTSAKCHGKFIKSPAQIIKPTDIDVFSSEAMGTSVFGNKNCILYQIDDTDQYFWIGWNFPYMGYKKYKMGVDSKPHKNDHYLDKLRNTKKNKLEQNESKISFDPFILEGEYGENPLLFTLTQEN